MTLFDIEVPMIATVNGPAHVNAEIAVLRVVLQSYSVTSPENEVTGR